MLFEVLKTFVTLLESLLTKLKSIVLLSTLSTINDISSDQSNTIIFAIPIEVMDAFKQCNAGDAIKKITKKK